MKHFLFALFLLVSCAACAQHCVYEMDTTAAWSPCGFSIEGGTLYGDLFGLQPGEDVSMMLPWSTGVIAMCQVRPAYYVPSDTLVCPTVYRFPQLRRCQ